MRSRRATEDDLKNTPAAVIEFGGSSWPAAERAGLVNAGGIWMTSEALQRMRAWKAAQALRQNEGEG